MQDICNQPFGGNTTDKADSVSTAWITGAKPIGAVLIECMSQQAHPTLPDKAEERVRTLARNLV